MKGKTKRFLSLLTAGVLVITSVPSALAEETSTPTKTAESITVNYSGGEKYVGSFISADELDVVVHYSDGSEEHKGGNATVHNVTADIGAPMVAVQGWNEYTVTYQDDSEGINLTGTFSAWGYQEAGINATYNGDAVLLNSTVDSSKISVNLVYTSHADGSDFIEPLNNSQYTLPSLTASNFGVNNFTVTSTKTAHGNTFTDDVQVYTYKEEVSATYTGENVKLGDDVDKNDISVVKKTTYSQDNSVNETPITSFTINPSTITKVGANEITVTTDIGSTTVNVTGYEEAPVVIESITVEYTGKDVRVDVSDPVLRYIPADEINVTLHYSDGSTQTVGSNLTVSGVTNGDAPEVKQVGWNTFMATYTEGGKSWSNTFDVWGYQLDRIEATYNGPEIRTQEDYNKADVSVTAYWTGRQDGTPLNYTPNSFEVNSLTVTKVGDNTFTATSEGKTDDFIVKGFDDRLYVDYIEAQYKGDDVLVGEDYDKDDIEVVYVYTNGTKSNPITDFDVNSTEVTKAGDNEFTVTVDNETAPVKVWGYELDRIEAEYNGPNIKTQENYDKADVSVTAYWTTRKDGTALNFTPNSFEVNSTKVTKVGNNDFTVTVEDKTAGIKVWGYELDRIEAEYNGPDIRTEENYNKADVSVTAYWTSRTDVPTLSFTPNSFEVDSLTVTKVGDNTFTATVEGKTDDFIVKGFDDRLYVDHIEAQYKGDDVLVGEDYDKDDIEVVYVYTDGSKSEPITNFDVNSTEVTKNGNNEFTVTVDNKTAPIKVWGYSPEAIEATYNGKNILVGNDFAKSDVTVILRYTAGSDGKKAEKTLTSADYTITETTVNTKGNNDFTVSTKDNLTDTFQVWGYDVDHIEAVYNGDDVRINETYNQKDVAVTAYYSTRTDNGEESFKVNTDDFTVNSLTVTQVGDNTFTATYNNYTDDFTVKGFDDNVYVSYITAEYVGPDILVGNSFPADDVVVTIHYTDGSERISENGFDIDPFVTGIGPVVNDVKWNTYTVTYQGKTADIKVWGYKPEKIEAEYVGPDILVGNEFSRSDVKVTLVYTPHSDATIDRVELSANQYTIPSDIKVSNVEWNDYTITYNNFTDDVEVWGYKAIAIDAEYTGDNVFVGKTVKASDIKVNLVYSPYSNGQIKKDTLNIEDCTVKAAVESAGLKTWKTGNNEFTVSYNNLSDKVNVWGYEYDHIDAEYTGVDIRTNEDYNKSDVKVSVYYTQRTDNGETSFVISNADDFEVNSTKVLVVGLNSYLATFEDLTDDFTVKGFDDRVYIDYITAEYVGPDILVGNSFPADDVVVTIHYTDGSERISENGFDIDPFEPGIGPIVEVKGWNDYTVTYQDKTAGIKVWGYEPKEIQATYNGPDILVDDSYSQDDVDVTLVYTPYHDGTVKTETLTKEQYTLMNAESVDSKVVTDLEWNTYTAKYKDLTDDIKVWGYKLDKLEAVYNGEAIYVNNNYDKKDVTVTATYTPASNGMIKSVNVENFEVDSLLVTKVGTNTYEATCEYGKAPFAVPGIEKEVVKTDNMFNIVALDRDSKEVKGVKVKYSTNGVSGTLTTGETTSAKLGVGTIITVDDCTITLPNGYKLHTATMGTATTETNTTYTLTIVVDKVVEDKEEPKDTPNVIKLVAVDKDGKEVNDVVLSYDKDGFKGHLKSGATIAHQLGVGTVITEKDYKLGIPTGYTFKDSKLTTEKGDTHTTYVVTVTLEKSANTNTPSNNPEAPQTGDETNAMLYMAIGGLALVSMLGLLVTKKKEEDEGTTEE